MMLAVLMVVLMYLLPTMAALGITTDTSEWSMGLYGRVADQVSDLCWFCTGKFMDYPLGYHQV